MASRESFQEVVMLFDPTGSKLESEMRLGQFNNLLAQKGTLQSRAGASVRAAYAQVGAGLSVHALVFFQFKVNDQGYVDPAFNLPLEYMAQHAGPGPRVGNARVRMACRSQCPVPWHAINLWEPAGEGRLHPAALVQKAVWRNRLELRVVPASSRARDAAVVEVRHEQRQVNAAAGRMAMAVNDTPRASGPGPVPPAGGPGDTPTRSVPDALTKMLDEHSSRSAASPRPKRGTAGTAAARAEARTAVRAMEDQLTATVGEAGRMRVDHYTRQHREHLGRLAEKFRDEMHRQQQGYLDQIKNCRNEIQQLKASLRHEQKRNQRLQQLLRGDV